MYLYIFYIGGSAGKSNIEVHDIQFVVADRPQDAWPALRTAWFGDADKIHVDGYAKISWADGYNISLSTTPSTTDDKLFFVNAGGYRPDSLAELHEFNFFVASSQQDAKVKALKTLLVGALQQHKDNLKDVDDCLLLDKVGDFYIHLTPCAEGTPFTPEWQGYQPIGVTA